MHPDVAAVDINWNAWSDTIDCLRQLRGCDFPQACLHLVVADNGSTDPPPEEIKEIEDVDVLLLGKNAGFAGGNNVAIRRALERDAEMVLLVNNDTILPPGFLLPLVQTLRDNPLVGLVCPKMYYADPPDRLWYAGARLREPRLLGEMIGMGEIDQGQYDSPNRTDYIVGACVLIRREVFERIGFLDELFFFYHEDVDFSLRAATAGYTCWYQPESQIWHRVSSSTRTDLPLRVYHYNRARTALLCKHIRGRRIPGAVILDVARLVRQVGTFALHGQLEQAAAVVRGTWDGLRMYGSSRKIN